MDSFAILILAQDNNKYHKLGDLAPFGDTTLLEWKISQCKQLTEVANIYISSSSSKIENIAKNENINFIHRSNLTTDVNNILFEFASHINQDNIFILNVTSPFLDETIYKQMYIKFLEQKCDVLASSLLKNEFCFFDNIRLNFDNKFISRETIEPIKIMTNGCYIVKTSFIREQEYLFGSKNIFLYALDKLSSIEIKDIMDYTIANDLISIYFKNLLCVKGTNI